MDGVNRMMVSNDRANNVYLSFQQLGQALDAQQNLALTLGRSGLSVEQLDYLLNLRQNLLERCCMDENMDILEQCDRDESLAAWLDSRQIPEPWEMAQPLCAAGADVALLARIEQNIGREALFHALEWLKSNLTTGELLLTLERALHQMGSND